MKILKSLVTLTLCLTVFPTIIHAKGPSVKSEEIVDIKHEELAKNTNKGVHNVTYSEDKKLIRKDPTPETPIPKAKATATPPPKTIQKTIKFKDGSYYIGRTLKNKPHGKGKFYSGDKKLLCDCEYNNGNLISGKSYFIDHPEFRMYNGKFKVTGSKSLFHGKGTMHYLNGNKYVGYFAIGKFNGKGTLYNKEGNEIAFGVWEKDQFVNGTQITANGDEYTGSVVEGQFYGKVSIKLKNGTRVEGEILDGIIRTGAVYNPDQSVYQGQLGANVPNGTGELKSASGKTLKKGMFVDGLLVDGELTDLLGDTYIGRFESERLVGMGKVVRSNGDEFSGNFVASQLSTGEIIFANKHEYVGEMKNFVPHGTGLLFRPDLKLRYEGVFIDGKLNGEVLVTDFDYNTRWEVWNMGEKKN